MPALNFQARFASLVAQGIKRQTIRATRKRPIRVGDTLYLYTGMRTKQCQKLKTANCTMAAGFRITDGDYSGFPAVRIIDGFTSITLKSLDQLNALAMRDGFADFNEMKAWFNDTHGLPFVGQLIRW